MTYSNPPSGVVILGNIYSEIGPYCYHLLAGVWLVERRGAVHGRPTHRSRSWTCSFERALDLSYSAINRRPSNDNGLLATRHGIISESCICHDAQPERLGVLGEQGGSMPRLCLEYLFLPILPVLSRWGIESVNSRTAKVLDSERVHDPLVLIDHSRSYQSLSRTSCTDGSERRGSVDMSEATRTSCSSGPRACPTNLRVL